MFLRLGGYHFAKAVLPLLLDTVDASPEYPPTLIFTSATAALRGSANCASFAAGKFALRALAQSLAREFGPKGIHVAHAIIDGVIDIERTKAYKFDHPDAKIKPEAVRLPGPRPPSPKMGHKVLTVNVVVSTIRLPTRTGTCIRSPGHASPTRSTSDPISKSGERSAGIVAEARAAPPCFEIREIQPSRTLLAYHSLILHLLLSSSPPFLGPADKGGFGVRSLAYLRSSLCARNRPKTEFCYDVHMSAMSGGSRHTLRHHLLAIPGVILGHRPCVAVFCCPPHVDPIMMQLLRT